MQPMCRPQGGKRIAFPGFRRRRKDGLERTVAKSGDKPNLRK